MYTRCTKLVKRFSNDLSKTRKSKRNFGPSLEVSDVGNTEKFRKSSRYRLWEKPTIGPYNGNNVDTIQSGQVFVQYCHQALSKSEVLRIGTTGCAAAFSTIDERRPLSDDQS